MYSRLSKLLKEREKSFVAEKNSALEIAAVLVLLHRQNGEDHILFTKRTETVAHHKGQICFPGGVQDKNDADLWTTALRETEEELGIAPFSVSYIGALAPMVTPTGFQVFPFVASLASPLTVSPSPHEIAEVFSVPFSHLRDPKNFKFRKFLPSTYEGPVFVYGTHEIWGVTARILVQLMEVY